MTSPSSDLSFLRQDIGLAILGTLVGNAGIAFWLATDQEGFYVLSGLGGLLAFVALWHLGWRLAFPTPIFKEPWMAAVATGCVTVVLVTVALVALA